MNTMAEFNLPPGCSVKDIEDAQGDGYNESVVRYKMLGTQISNLQAERDSIRDNDLIPCLQNGEALEYGEEILLPEYTTRVDFDYQRALKDGAISDDVLRQYSKVQVIQRLMFRKRDSESARLTTYLSKLQACYQEYKNAK